ncbi:MAG: PilZ domain-containing protein [Lentilitoribacter sp.]
MAGQKSSKDQIKGTEGNFLSRLIVEEQREHVRRQMYAPCKVGYMKGGLRGYSVMKGMIVDLSEGGAQLKLPFMLTRGQDLYLLLQNFPYKLAAVVVDVTDVGTHLKFANTIPPEAVHQIASGRPYVKPTKAKTPKKKS